VNVTLSKRGSYAVRAAVCLAQAYGTGTPKKLREVSAQMSIPRTFVSQILGDLVRAGIAVSSFGRGGGHRLARPPGEISVAEVIEAAEGRLSAERCALGEGPCRWHAVCPLHETMADASTALREVLATTTLAAIAERDQAIRDGTYPSPADSRPNAAMVAAVDSMQVERPAAVVAWRLRSGNGWLSGLAAACDPDGARVPSGPRGQDWLGRTVALHLKDPVEGRDCLMIPLLWEAISASALFPRFEGELRLTGLDPERSELRISGFFRSAPGGGGQDPDLRLLSRAATVTLRSFLRRVALVLESEIPCNPHEALVHGTSGLQPSPAGDPAPA
jgi:Rrf2 family protein